MGLSFARNRLFFALTLGDGLGMFLTLITALSNSGLCVCGGRRLGLCLARNS
jgi:hypothetical protein